jgi:WD40 repeat protein
LETNNEILSLEDGMGMTRIVAAHPTNGNLLVSAAAEAIHIWDIESKEQIETFTLPEGQYSINSLSFSKNGFVSAIIQYVGYEEERKDSSFLVIGYMK